MQVLKDLLEHPSDNTLLLGLLRHRETLPKFEKIRDRITGQLLKRIEGPGLWVYDVALSPDQKTLFMNHYNREIRAVNLDAGTWTDSSVQTSTGMYLEDVDFFSMDLPVVGTDANSVTTIWDPHTGAKIDAIDPSPIGTLYYKAQVSLDPLGRFIALDPSGVRLGDERLEIFSIVP